MDQFLNTFLNWDYIWQVFPDLLKTGLVNTLILAITSFVIGTALAVPLAIMGLSTKRWLRWPARVYTDIFRGLPAILTILVIGQGLGTLARPIVGTSPYPLGILALSLIAAAYIGEIFRSGIQSVEKGQLEASRALGMSYSRAMLLVVIPQGIRRVLPALVNQFISVVKDTPLVYFLGFATDQRELFRIGQDLTANTGNQSPLVAAGIVYLVITVPLTHLVNFIDKRLQTGRKVQAAPDDGDLVAGGKVAS
ncbi:amino acid ABC transporter permease [Amycolatopsis saalfeldensis]|uniref:Polar amino acid transport system permease protein n=1 Tax=Amycolatopsis saalfeldensis TaxID=394193 RepID=A0A1H8YJA1_9PSEU|nr:amino acid ABC transporter permease [Amycolatopsis saalfeldensis]SEP52250.1 polar amino acid transport system permease protein [Amycolatopsis saalfeldensis]